MNRLDQAMYPGNLEKWSDRNLCRLNDLAAASGQAATSCSEPHTSSETLYISRFCAEMPPYGRDSKTRVQLKVILSSGLGFFYVLLFFEET